MARQHRGSESKRLLAEFGARVREVREERGLSQATVAKQIGLTRSSIWNIEHGLNDVGIPVLLALSVALGVNVRRLLPKFEASDNDNDLANASGE